MWGISAVSRQLLQFGKGSLGSSPLAHLKEYSKAFSSPDGSWLCIVVAQAGLEGLQLGL